MNQPRQSAEEALKRFLGDWTEESIEHLPQAGLTQGSSDELSLTMLLIQADFEQRWKLPELTESESKGEGQPLRFPRRPRAEDYLGRFPHLAEEGLEGLYRAEIRARQLVGDFSFHDDLPPRLLQHGLSFEGLATAVDQTTITQESQPHEAVGISEMSSEAEFGPRGRLPEELLREQLVQALGTRFEIREVLGKGGFGTVFGGQDRELDRAVAIKVIELVEIRPAEQRARALEEAKTLARLDHPAIVPLYDVGYASDRIVYLISKWIQGQSLASSLSEHRPSVLEASRIVLRIAQALSAAHKQGLIHRDIKPGNILLDHQGTAFLCDFGLAMTQGGVSSLRSAGTPAYMSPEQAMGEIDRLDARSDLFSLGVVFYEMLTGDRLFRGRTTHLLQQLSTLPIPPPSATVPDLHPLANAICLKALQRDPESRYASATELVEDLTRLVSQLERGVTKEKELKTGMRVGSLGCSVQVGITLTALAVLTTVAWYLTQTPTNNVAVNWGWDQPGIVGSNLNAAAYLESLASAAEKWKETDRSTPQALKTRLSELRHACDTLLASDHPALTPSDRDWLRERCRAWRDKVDEQLVALEQPNPSFTEIQTASDEIIAKLVTALRGRAAEVS